MVEVKIQDEEFRQLAKSHYDPTENPFFRTLQRYDRIAARIIRRHFSPITSRYSWRARAKDDAQQLVRQIETYQGNVLAFYRVIRASNELTLLNESLEYGHSSLRNHLLVITNLIVTDWLKSRLDISSTGITVGRP